MTENPLPFISYVRAQKNLMEIYIKQALDELQLTYWFDDELNQGTTREWWSQIASQTDLRLFYIFLLLRSGRNRLSAKDNIRPHSNWKKRCSR